MSLVFKAKHSCQNEGWLASWLVNSANMKYSTHKGSVRDFRDTFSSFVQKVCMYELLPFERINAKE